MQPGTLCTYLPSESSPEIGIACVSLILRIARRWKWRYLQKRCKSGTNLRSLPRCATPRLLTAHMYCWLDKQNHNHIIDDTNTKKRRVPDTPLTDTEQQALLAAWRLGDDAYGATIRDELARCTGKRLTPSAVYVTLVRLERRGLVASSMSDPTPVRGGKARRQFKIRKAGVQALRRARRDMERLWEGLDATPEFRGAR